MPQAPFAAARDQPADGAGVVAIIGSGFGGAVVARRLAQANRALPDPLRIVLLERGRRYGPEDFPRIQLPDYLTDDAGSSSSKRVPDAARLAWSYDQGLWQIRDLRRLRVAAAAGYGGGSLIYAGVHLRPPAAAFEGWPGDYSRATLDPFYQLAEAMLDVRPAPPLWGKTAAMRQTAALLEREDSFFRPPLAVTFDELPADPPVTRRNGFGVQQSGCIGCGECIIGCPHGAKNTLDHNYLAGIEEMGVEVRTLCEAIGIDRLSTASGQGTRFRVEYRDHLKGSQKDCLPAEYVFVCAGALGSTELLMRSSSALNGNSETTGLAALGTRFFGNGDAPGVIFGTAKPWGPSSGPTITTSMYYAEQGRWFLLQEGGIPRTLMRGLGFLQSPLWLKRNAFGSKSSPSSLPAPLQTPASLQELTDTLSNVPRVSRALAVAALGERATDDSTISALLPKSLQALVEPFGPPAETLRRHVTEVGGGVVDRLASGYRGRIPLFGRIIAWGIEQIGHTPHVADATIAELVDRFAALATVRDSTSVPMLGVQTLIDAVLGAPPTESTAILLAMGPDSRWTLTLDPATRRLQAEGDTAENVKLYGMQERLMRDIAQSLGGELRTNPGWTLGKNPLTVHAQGGCSMGDVTNPDGLMVRGIEGLYVFDASVFPNSVGVNPSSTIAAVSERNIELFIRTTLAKRAEVLEDWTAVAAEEKTFPSFAGRLDLKQEQWDGEAGRVLDHLPTAPAAKATVPGLVFNEVMEGFIGDVQGEPPVLDPPQALEERVFRDLERAGLRSLQHAKLELHALIPDLDHALLNPETFEFSLTGCVTISWAENAGTRGIQYTLESGSLVVDLDAQAGVSKMTYKLEATDSTGPLERVRLFGVKQLRDDPGLDVWKDLTTLYVIVDRVPEAGDVGTYGGIVHVPLLDFLGTQLPSIDVIGDDITPERKSWLLLRFVQYFFRGLGKIYPIGDL